MPRSASPASRRRSDRTPSPRPRSQEAKLIAVLKSDAPRKDKADACRELALIGTKDAVAPLAALLGDEKLAHMARYALEPIPDPAVDDALRDALGKLKGRPLVGVIGSIGVRRDAKAVEPLSKLLKDTDPDVAQAAARALGRIGTRAGRQGPGRAPGRRPGRQPAGDLRGPVPLRRGSVGRGQRGKRSQPTRRSRSTTGLTQARGAAPGPRRGVAEGPPPPARSRAERA